MCVTQGLLKLGISVLVKSIAKPHETVGPEFQVVGRAAVVAAALITALVMAHLPDALYPPALPVGMMNNI